MNNGFRDKNKLVDTLHNLPKDLVDIFVEDLLKVHGINMENYIDRYVKAETENNEPTPNNNFSHLGYKAYYGILYYVNQLLITQINVDELIYIHEHQRLPNHIKIIFISKKRGSKANLARLFMLLGIPISKARHIFYDAFSYNDIPSSERFHNSFYFNIKNHIPNMVNVVEK